MNFRIMLILLSLMGVAFAQYNLSISVEPKGNDENIQITNNGADGVQLNGWRVCDLYGWNNITGKLDWENHYYTFKKQYVLEKGQTITLYTGNGTDDPLNRTFYWNHMPEPGYDHWEIWNNNEDTAYLIDDKGKMQANRSYGNGGTH
jgi:hypothetical protein